MAESTLSGGGASSAIGASNAQQATGGESSQNGAIASTEMTPEQKKTAEDFENYGKYQYKEAVMKKAVEDMKKSSGGSNSETEEPTVVHLTPYITKETSDALKSSNGNMTIQMNPEVYEGKTITVYEKSSSSQNETVDDVPLTVDRFKGKVPDVVADTQTRTVTSEMIISDYEKPTGMELYRQTLEASSAIPYFGTVAKTVETVTVNPLTNEFDPILPISAQQLHYRMNEWEMKEGTALERATAGIEASKVAADLALMVGGSWAIGFAGEAASFGLGRLSATKFGSAVTNVITKPWISNRVMNGAAPAMVKVTDIATQAMDRLPVGLRVGLDKVGKKTISPQALSSIGVGMMATSAGLDAKYAIFAKQGLDAGFKLTKKLSNPNSKLRAAYNFYTNPLISAANIIKVADGFKTAGAAVIKAEAVIATRFPHGYKAATAVKNVISTPKAAVMNALQIGYYGDAAYRLVTSDNKVKTAAQIALELPTGFWGAKLGIKTADRLNEYLTTKGRTFIPIQRIGYAEGIPLGKGMTDKTLEISFAENTPIPRPYMFGRTKYQNQPTPQNAKLPSTHPYDTERGFKIDETFPGFVWHATPQGERLGEKIIVGDSTSELPGIYTSEVGIGYYLHLEQKSNLKPALLITQSDPSYTPKFATFRILGVNRIPEYASGSRKEMADFLRSGASPIRAYAPNMKEEYEALLPPGATFTRIGKGYYTRINGHKVAIDEYAPDLDVSYEFMEFRHARNVSENEKIRNISTDDLIKITKDKVKRKYGNELRVYRAGSSSYGKAAGRQVPLGGSSYGGSKLARSVSKGIPSGYSQKSGVSLGASGYSLSSAEKLLSGKGGSGGKSAGVSLGGSGSSKGTSIISGTVKAPVLFSKSPYHDVNIGVPYKKQKDDLRKRDIDIYKAARRGRIDHLSLVDPLEFLGRGSLTNRNKADMTLYREKIYLIDNAVTGKKPEGRRKK